MNIIMSIGNVLKIIISNYTMPCPTQYWIPVLPIRHWFLYMCANFNEQKLPQRSKSDNFLYTPYWRKKFIWSLLLYGCDTWTIGKYERERKIGRKRNETIQEEIGETRSM
uniref:Uncharacterized protein n=1 Tax=Cacopsylla melanoneura TaxID=428564 RepID=A0A8D8Y1J2_9HEMI